MILSKKINMCNIYMLVWLLGYIQNIYMNNSFLSLVLYIPFVLMTSYYIMQVVLRYRLKGAIKSLLFFFFILCIYGLFLLILNDAAGQDPKSFLMMLFSSLGPVFSFYVFARQGKLSEKNLKFFFVIFLIVAIMDYFEYERKMFLLLAQNNPFEEITNNTTYYFVGLLPFLFLFNKRPVCQYLSIACILGFVLAGMKRGAILTSLLILVWFICRTFKSSSWKKRVVIVAALCALFFVGSKFVETLYSTNMYFQQRIEDTVEGQSSGRDKLYVAFWNHYINNDNILQVLFGEGAYHTENIMHLKAHNDWLELLIDCGLFGVILYLIYWYRFMKDWIKSRSNTIIYSMMGACLIFTFVRTFFSMSFSDMPISICMMMGYCWGQSYCMQRYKC